jgi:hypothetical protein
MSHPFNAELQPGWVRREARHTDILTCRLEVAFRASAWAQIEARADHPVAWQGIGYG